MEIYSLKQFRLYGKVQDFPLPLPLTSPFKSSRVAQLKNNLRASFRVDHISIELSNIGSTKETSSVCCKEKVEKLKSGLNVYKTLDLNSRSLVYGSLRNE